MNSLPKTVTRQRRGCDLNPGPSAPESTPLFMCSLHIIRLHRYAKQKMRPIVTDAAWSV